LSIYNTIESTFEGGTESPFLKGIIGKYYRLMKELREYKDSSRDVVDIIYEEEGTEGEGMGAGMWQEEQEEET
jgi:hypothetical protein